MSLTYLLLNIVFLVGIGALLFVITYLLKIRLRYISIVYTLVILLIFTVLFDSLIIQAGIVDYDDSKLLGVFLWQAPVEDFFYSILAAAMIPVMWQIGEHIHERKK